MFQVCIIKVSEKSEPKDLILMLPDPSRNLLKIYSPGNDQFIDKSNDSFACEQSCCLILVKATFFVSFIISGFYLKFVVDLASWDKLQFQACGGLYFEGFNFKYVLDLASWARLLFQASGGLYFMGQASTSSLCETLLHGLVVDLASTFGSPYLIKDCDKPHRHIFIFDTQRGSRTRPLSLEVYPTLIAVLRIESIPLEDFRSLDGLPIDGTFFNKVVHSARDFLSVDDNGIPRSCKFLFFVLARLAGGDLNREEDIRKTMNREFRPSKYARAKEPFITLDIPNNLRKETYLAAFFSCWICKFLLPGKEIGYICANVFEVASNPPCNASNPIMIATGSQSSNIDVVGDYYWNRSPSKRKKTSRVPILSSGGFLEGIPSSNMSPRDLVVHAKSVKSNIFNSYWHRIADKLSRTSIESIFSIEVEGNMILAEMKKVNVGATTPSEKLLISLFEKARSLMHPDL
ncbi:hypothetical protein M9H77_11345 [Catharanthus roseus]|uniref:Uncharacterized protein n=1 Tax=Catharanthus roseus TaxID=4058 RepID=A0ACC0BE98_CATRO|nr:hypothetical protein M9H77_11345 [Catharanthus roseus]